MRAIVHVVVAGLRDAISRATRSLRSPAREELRLAMMLSARREREVRDEELAAVLHVIADARRYYERTAESGDEIPSGVAAALVEIEECLENKFHQLLLDPRSPAPRLPITTGWRHSAAARVLHFDPSAPGGTRFCPDAEIRRAIAPQVARDDVPRALPLLASELPQHSLRVDVTRELAGQLEPTAFAGRVMDQVDRELGQPLVWCLVSRSDDPRSHLEISKVDQLGRSVGFDQAHVERVWRELAARSDAEARTQERPDAPS